MVSFRRPIDITLHFSIWAILGNAQRQRWQPRQSRQCEIYNLQVLLSPPGFESHSLRQCRVNGLQSPLTSGMPSYGLLDADTSVWRGICKARFSVAVKDLVPVLREVPTPPQCGPALSQITNPVNPSENICSMTCLSPASFGAGVTDVSGSVCYLCLGAIVQSLTAK
jgi:hypothetical protein